MVSRKRSVSLSSKRLPASSRSVRFTKCGNECHNRGFCTCGRHVVCLSAWPWRSTMATLEQHDTESSFSLAKYTSTQPSESLIHPLTHNSSLREITLIGVH